MATPLCTILSLTVALPAVVQANIFILKVLLAIVEPVIVLLISVTQFQAQAEIVSSAALVPQRRSACHPVTTVPVLVHEAFVKSLVVM